MESFLAQELRGGWLGIPEPFHPFDFLGVALGSYFAWVGLRHGELLTVALGAVMIGIHSNRFLYAPQDREGLERLLASLDLGWEDVCPS